MATIPEYLVKKFYAMNPKTEDLLADGSFLKEGMVVLVESPNLREDLDDPDYSTSPIQIDRANVWNRWSSVSHIKYDRATNMVSFVSTYSDGTKRKRCYNEAHAWFVRLDSMPKTLAQTSEENLPTPSGSMCDHAHDDHCCVAECYNYVGRFTN